MRQGVGKQRVFRITVQGQKEKNNVLEVEQTGTDQSGDEMKLEA